MYLIRADNFYKAIYSTTVEFLILDTVGIWGSASLLLSVTTGEQQHPWLLITTFP